MIDFLDPDATYDILFAQKINGTVLSLLKNAISTRGIFDDPFPLCFIDRIVPSGLSPWADNWSGKMFGFLKKLSRTHILDDGYLNGSAYGFEPEYSANLPGIINLEDYHADSITVIVPPGTRDGILTWIERSHDPLSAPYCDRLVNKIACTTRRSRLFNNPGITPQTYTISTQNWLHNSVCFARIELQGLTDNQAQFLLYDRMQSFLDYLWGELGISELNVLTAFTIKNTKIFSVRQANRDFPGLVQSSAYMEDSLSSSNIEFTNPIFFALPSFYHNAYLSIDGIEHGAITAVFDRSSQNITISINYDYSYLDFFDSFFSPPLKGYELNQAPYSNKNYSEIKVPIPGDPSGLQVCYASFKNNHDIENFTAGVSDWREWTTYPPLALHQYAQATTHNSPLRKFNVGFYSESSNVAYRSIVGGNTFITLESEGSQESGGFLGWNGGGFNFGRQYSWLLESYSSTESTKRSDTLQFRKDFLSVSFFSDPILFSAFDVYLLNSDLAIGRELQYAFDPEAGYENGGWVLDYCTRREIVQKTAIRIRCELGSALMQIPAISWNATENSATVIFASTDTADNLIESGETASQATIPVEIQQSVPVTRSLRLSPPEYPTLIVFDYSQPTPLERVTIYYGEPGEDELQSILYPDGPDGPPLLDPDTDQGDIMPDSTRIKEIHAALDAARFANHPQSTEAEPRVNLRTLGRLIEATSYVLGVNFNEDGMNIPYPEPRLFDPEKIEEVNDRKLLKNSQFAVAQMGNGLDTSSLYEVRSALMKRDGSETVLDLRPHAIKYHNLPQLLDALSDDVSRHLGGASSAAFQVPAADGWRAQNYAGLTQAIADLLYMSSVHSKSINELQNQSIKSVWMLQQVLKALGLPLHITKLEGVSGIKDPVEEGDLLRAYMAVPELDAKAPTLTSLLGIVLLNLQRLVGASVSFREENPEA